MPIFRCECCYYTTHLKQHYTTHLKSKKHLNNELNNEKKQTKTEENNSSIKPIINHYKFIIELPKNLTTDEQLTYIDNFKKYQIYKLLTEKNDDTYISIYDNNTQIFLNNQKDKINISNSLNLVNETINKDEKSFSLSI